MDQPVCNRNQNKKVATHPEHGRDAADGKPRCSCLQFRVNDAGSHRGAPNGKRGKLPSQASGPFFVPPRQPKVQPKSRQAPHQGNPQRNRAMHNLPLSPTPKAHVYICADCGRATTIATDDPGFGLCGECESRLNLQKGKWNKNAPAAGVGKGGSGGLVEAQCLTAKQPYRRQKGPVK